MAAVARDPLELGIDAPDASEQNAQDANAHASEEPATTELFPETQGDRRGSDGSDVVDPVPMAKRDRRMSKEWDASLTPPSRFQKVEGSIFATPSSRDGHIARNKIHGYKEKVRELAGKK